MAKQLNEMKYDRELQNQTLPWISELNFCVEKPRLYYSPPEKEHSAHSRYWAYLFVKNLGSFHAVCTDVSSHIIVLKNKSTTDYDACLGTPLNNSSDNEKPNEEKILLFDTTSIRIDILEEKEKYPANKPKGDDFLFADDQEGILLKRLIDSNIVGYPILKIRIHYKNVLGACFALYNVYQIYPTYTDGEINPVIKDWLSKILSFPITYSNELGRLKNLKKSNNKKEHDELFAEVKTKYNDSLLNGSSEPNFEKLRVIPIPGYFSIKPISEEEYLEATKDISYGFVPF